MNAKLLIFASAFLMVTWQHAHCQTTIGSLAPPAGGTILDLNGEGSADPVRGGLVLSNVALSDTALIPSLPGPFHAVVDRASNPALAGMLVYNTTADPCEGLMPGVYCWNGYSWQQISGEEPVCPSVPDESGNYALKGKSCIDVNMTSSYECGETSARPNDFEYTKTFKYWFEQAGHLTHFGLTFRISDPEGVVAGYSQQGDTCYVRFVGNIRELARGRTADNPIKIIITARYIDFLGEMKTLSLTVRVQDCACGCSVRSTTEPYRWLTFMCYNLGVNELGRRLTVPEQIVFNPNFYGQSLEEVIYGHVFQWGRRSDGHELRNAPNRNGSYTGPFDYNGQIPPSATGYYGYNIIETDKPHDWRNPHTSNLWDGTTPTSDPCPDGWRVPTLADFRSIVNGDGNPIINQKQFDGLSGNHIEWVNGRTNHGLSGWKFSPDGGANYTLFLPSAGHRTYLGGIDSGYSGAYWTRSFRIGVNPYYIHFQAPGRLYLADTQDRAYSCSVRCVSE
jgi:uncharacterized protein (TIGR02145 family)